jgi:hypothetical protein
MSEIMNVFLTVSIFKVVAIHNWRSATNAEGLFEGVIVEVVIASRQAATESGRVPYFRW